MKRFKDLGITTNYKSLIGDKIKMERILNREVIVEAFKVEQSKFEDKGECLYIQIDIDNSKRVAFTGSRTLIEAIKQTKAEDLPFKTTIIKANGYYEFT